MWLSRLKVRARRNLTDDDTMRLLITGGCGFLGSNLAKKGLENGDKLLILDNLSRLGASENLQWLKRGYIFEFLQYDIRKYDQVEEAVVNFRPDVIFHLAGQVAMTTSLENPRVDFEVNALGTLNILEAVRKCTPDTVIIYSSTNKVYGDLTHLRYEETDTRYICRDYPCGFNETIGLEFCSPYGCSKGTADQYLIDYARCYNLKTVVFRHSSMYGGRQFATVDQGWIGWFCEQAIRQKEFPNTPQFSISGTGKQVRDVLHAKDMIDLYFKSIEYIDIAQGQVFNIGGDTTTAFHY